MEKKKLKPSPSARKRGIKTVVCFPLKFNERALGVLYLHFKDKRLLNESEILKLVLIADQAAIAINNAQQYELLNDYIKLVGKQASPEYNVTPNSSLRIGDPQNILPRLAQGLRVKAAGELRELFQMLFAECEEIVLLPLSQGRSGARVVEVDIVSPHIPSVIVKIGVKDMITRESDNWDTYVFGKLDRWFTVKGKVCYTQKLGGIVYSLIG